MKLRKSTKFGLVLIAMFTAFSFWYLGTYSMGVITPYEVNEPSSEKHLLIVTQQSAYKDSLTAGIVRAFRDKPVYINVIDLTTAATYQAEREVDACILLHTWEIGRPPGMVHAFRDSLGGKVPLLAITTSGSGSAILDDEVDGISSASELFNTELDIKRAVIWLNYALGFAPLDYSDEPELPGKTHLGSTLAEERIGASEGN
ncbi:hypothetical protein [Neolewinella persica]|uniref:hypothetical protein n=1 Tax=Neolewinella persica TaxID=70998 RepID=UPI000380D9CA|nr:hypothetical protein [Neolewinella persica]